MPCLFSHSLNQLVDSMPTQGKSPSGKRISAKNQESLQDLEMYADLMENLSEIQEVDTRI